MILDLFVTSSYLVMEEYHRHVYAPLNYLRRGFLILHKLL